MRLNLHSVAAMTRFRASVRRNDQSRRLFDKSVVDT
jgi:hypothetical protein